LYHLDITVFLLQLCVCSTYVFWLTVSSTSLIQLALTAQPQETCSTTISLMQVCGNDSSDGAGGCYNDMVAMASSGNDANGGT